MAIVSNSGWFNSVAGDREYDAVKFNERFDNMVSDGVVTKGGALGTKCEVTATGTSMNVQVNTGYVNIKGAYCEITTAGNLAIDLAGADDRIDRVIIEYDNSLSGRTVTPKILEGTPATSPVAPTLTQTTDLYQISLAQVYVASGDTVILPGDITDERVASQVYSNDETWDVVIRTQDEFNTMVASPTWLDAKSVLIIGGGGNNTTNPTVFAAATNGEYCYYPEIEIPATVRNIKGINGAEIWMNQGDGLHYASKPTNFDYSIENIIINNLFGKGIVNCVNIFNCYAKGRIFNGVGIGYQDCDRIINSIGIADGVIGWAFDGCKYIINCDGTSTATTSDAIAFEDSHYILNCSGVGTSDSGIGVGFNSGFIINNCTGKGISNTGNGVGFQNCNKISNCFGKGTGTTGYSYYLIDSATNCTTGTSTTDMWGGTNTNINVETCRKTPVTANNTTLNT